MKFSSKKITRSLLKQLICIIIGLIICFPILYAVSVSFMSGRDLFSRDIHIFPSDLYLGNYSTVFKRINIVQYMINSFVVAGICSFSRIFIGSMAAFALEFYEFRFKKAIYILILSTALIPQEIIFVQNYVTLSKLQLLNTYMGICSVYLVNALSIFILCQTFSTYPKSIKDASNLDGCGSAKFFFKILLPTNKVTLIALFFTSFVTLWNVYLWPIVVTNLEELRTMQVAITILKGRDSPDFGPVMAGAVISLLPAILLFLLSRILSKNNRINFEE